MQKKIVIILDCGATNVRAVGVDEDGNILAIHKESNHTADDPNFEGGLIWDVDDIWKKLTLCIKSILGKLPKNHISGISVTSFGVNGAPVDYSGMLLYPVISWQCQRTVPEMDLVHQIIDAKEIYRISGVYPFSFNTLYVLHWLKRNNPEILERMTGFLFFASIFVHKLTGELVNDSTMAGTSMLLDSKTGKFSEKLLNTLGLPNKFFVTEAAGTIVGKTTSKASSETGLPEGVPVVLSGHDTQFALIGSGANTNEAVLSSGTWEILMTRTKHINTGSSGYQFGLTNELDAVPGLYDTGSQWLASGVLEWIKNLYYSQELGNEDLYALMIKEASDARIENLPKFSPDFTTNKGKIENIGLHTTRGEIYRSALEALAGKVHDALKIQEDAGKFKAQSLIVAGGGVKNNLWNQLRANKLGLPIKLVKETETTVLGAAMNTFSGIGVYKNLEEAQVAMHKGYSVVEPENYIN